MKRWAWFVIAVTAAACGKTPTGPTPPPPPPNPGPATPPVVRSIAVPASRVETGADITITAVVEDAETPLTKLLYQWAANVGTITGDTATATWRHPAGLQKGVDVVITLTVVDRYEAIENNQIVQREFRVLTQAAPFRVHDSLAETKELARRFLVDLFGNSSLGPSQVLVDFTDTCATLPNGKNDEANDIIDHRTKVIVQQVTIFSQAVSFPTMSTSYVASDTEFLDKWIVDGIIRPYRNSFVVTGVYEVGRWWLCQSTVPDKGSNAMGDALYMGKRNGRVPIK
jgi:hypothetical protein